MNRTLTATVALAAGLGIAGLAHAQSTMGTSASPGTMNPSTPGSQMTSPPPAPSATPSATPSYGAQRPQASSQMNQTGSQQITAQSQIQQAQEQLKSKGLYNGSIDGVVGPETQTALSQFQRQNGLPATAQLDQETMDRLMSAGASGGATATTPYTAPAGTQNPATAPMQRPTTSSPGAPSTNR
jgi:peptidoglycan hydrolase-like protein with peptidoglycan-binding domain